MEGRNWVERGRESGSDVGRDRREGQRARRMNGNQLAGAEVGVSLRCARTWDGEGSQESIGMTLVETPRSGDIENEQTTFCSQAGPPVEE